MEKNKKKLIPTFDEWYARNHMGFSFDANYLLPEHDARKAVVALTKEIRSYISEVMETFAGE